MRSSVDTPSYVAGFAPRDGAPRHAHLWRGLVGAWSPTLGATGTTLRDQSCYQNHGALIDMPPDEVWVADGGSRALHVQGDGFGTPYLRHIEIPSSDSLSITSAISISSWMKLTASTTNDGFLRKQPRDYFLEIKGAKPTLQVRFRTNTETDDALPYGEWVHVTATFDGTVPSVAMYVNGIAVAHTSAYLVAGAFQESDDVLQVGRYLGIFDGLFDDLVLHNRALTPREAWQLYDIGRGGIFEMSPSMVAAVPAVAGPPLGTHSLLGVGR